MIESLRILIVEDERILAETIASMVTELGHHVVDRVNSKAKALESIHRGGFDMAILDINLKTGDEGIELGKELYERQVPFFFLTSYSDSKTLQLAKTARPSAYVVKPFTEKDLFIAIEMSSVSIANSQPSLVIRKGNAYSRVNISDIEFLKADNVYTEIHANGKTWLKRSTLKDLLDEIDQPNFMQTHRSYAVNTAHITGWSSKKVIIGDEEIPVSRSHWEDIKDRLEQDAI